jgi:branched-chain amino acid transport system permease protein
MRSWGRCWLIALPVATLLLGQYHGALLAEFALLGGATAALAIAWGYGGILSFAQSVLFGLGAYSVAWFGLHGGASGVVVGLLVGIGLGGAVALLLGVVGLRGRFDPVRFALLTFISTLVAAQIATGWTSVTGGYNGLNSIPRLHLGQVALDPTSQRVVVTAVGAAVVAVLMAVAKSPFGALLVLVREQPKRAAALGYHVPAVRIAIFTACGLVTALLGGLYATQIQSVDPSIVDLPLATNFVVWTLLGSRASVPGAFLAAVVINVVTTELATRAVDYWLLITGVLFVLVVRFFPDGIAVAIRELLPHSWYRAHPVTVRTRSATPHAATDSSQPALSARGIACHFGPFRALDEVDLDVRPAGIHCLIGPNGAGKSTLLNVLSGQLLGCEGHWSLAGRDITGARPWTLARSGIARKFQAPAVAHSLTVSQNLLLAEYGARHRLAPLVIRRWSTSLTDQAWAVLQLGGLDSHLETPVSQLSHGQRQLLELAMTLAAGCEVLLLDEPTAGMTHAETERVATVLRELADVHRLPILMVEHDVNLIRSIADRVTVLRDGAVLSEGTIAEVGENRDVQAAYLGHA